MTDIAVRWSGILLMVGAVLFGVATVLISLNPTVGESISMGNSLLFLLASMFLLLSLPAMYARQAGAAGWLGLVGHGLLQTGILLLLVVALPSLLYPSLNLAPEENPIPFFLGIALTGGLLLSGMATIRASVYPRWAGILLVAATVGFFFDFFIAEFLPPQVGQIGSAFLGVLLGFALAWIGFAMWAGELPLSRTSAPRSAYRP